MERTTAKVLMIAISILCLTGGFAADLAADSSSVLSIQGSSTVSENTQSPYTAFMNGTKVTASWSVSSTRYASIDSTTGILTAGAVSSNQTVIITALSNRRGTVYRAYKTITITNNTTSAGLTALTVSGPSSVNSGGTGSYTATATFSNNTTQNVTQSASWSVNPAVGTISGGTYSPGQVTANQNVTISASYTSGGVTRNGTFAATVTASAATGGKSINSTSQNRATLPSTPVAEQPLTNLSGFSIFGVNDLGMHCGDLDHRIASILPPFNTLHAQVIQKRDVNGTPQDSDFH